MSIKSTAQIFTRGIAITLDGVVVPGHADLSGIGGSANTRDLTTHQDDAIVKYAGLHDGGTITLSGVCNPNDPGFIALREANENSSTKALRITLGAPGTGPGPTDGTAFEVIANRTMTVALETGKAVFSDTNDNTLPGIGVNDYVEYFTGNAPGTRNTELITAVSVSSGTAKFTTDLSTAPTLTANTKIRILRAASQLSASVTVESVERNAPTNDSWRFTASLAVNGKVAEAFGTPNIASI